MQTFTRPQTIAEILENLAIKQMEAAGKLPTCYSCEERLAHGEGMCGRCAGEDHVRGEELADQELERKNHDF